MLCCLLLVLTVASRPVSAQPAYTLEDFHAVETASKVAANRTIRTFTFAVTLRNAGSSAENVSVFFADPDLGMPLFLGYATLEAGQEKVFSLDNHPIAAPAAFTVNVSFRPTSPQVLRTTGNAGFAIFTVGSSQQNRQTPGFDMLLTILGLFLAALFLMLRRRT